MNSQIFCFIQQYPVLHWGRLRVQAHKEVEINPVCITPLRCPCLSAQTRNLIPPKLSLGAPHFFCLHQGAADVWKCTPQHALVITCIIN